MSWSSNNLNITEDLFEKAQQLGFGQLHLKIDAQTGMQAIIAIHDETRGSALGGVRLYAYPNSWAALLDAMRLARGMTYKSAIAQLPHGGGKAVLIQPTQIPDRAALFKSFANFVNELNGRYITAMDSGTHVSDMDIIAQTSHYVTCSTPLGGDPSPYTAKGVFECIKAAKSYRWGDKPLNECHVVIQGVGHVGLHLASLLHAEGVKLTVSDVNRQALHECVETFHCQSLDPAHVYDYPCDIFAPCALGAILNDDTIGRLNTSIVIGSANNQLAASHHALALKQRGIMYAPDYVVNAGGLIFAASQVQRAPEIGIDNKIKKIADTLLLIFERAEQENRSTAEIADHLAQERLQQVAHKA